MLVGTIKEWNQLKGWGFIEDDDGYDLLRSDKDLREHRMQKL